MTTATISHKFKNGFVKYKKKNNKAHIKASSWEKAGVHDVC